MREKPWWLVPGVLLVLAAGIVVWRVCSDTAPPRPHPACGKWSNGLVSLIVYPDRLATLNGVRCAWEEVDRTTIRIHPPTRIEIPFLGVIEFSFDFRLLPGGRRGVLELLGHPVMLQRSDAAPLPGG